MAKSAMGPFYCPADQRVYIDLGCYDQLKNRFHAPGDVAQAYVIAHEVGHHIQTLAGISGKVHAACKKLSQKEGNKLSVQQELKADCLAGTWANYAYKAIGHPLIMISPGDRFKPQGVAAGIISVPTGRFFLSLESGRLSD
jgi:predicted metalloprotease